MSNYKFLKLKLGKNCSKLLCCRSSCGAHCSSYPHGYVLAEAGGGMWLQGLGPILRPTVLSGLSSRHASVCALCF